MQPTPSTSRDLPFRPGPFGTFTEGLDYAARGDTGFNFYSARGDLTAVLPYRELRERAVAAAQGLIRAGLPRGARMVLIADTVPDFMVLFAACQYAGLLPVPVALPTGLGGRDSYIATLRRQIQSCGAEAAMAPAELLDYLKEAAAGTSARLVGAAADFLALPGDGAALRPFAPEESCYLQFSSGSTRFPKGIDVPQRALMANAHAIAVDGLGLTPEDRAVSWLPLYHDMGLVGFMLVPLLSQVTVDYLATRDFARRPLMWPSLISRNRGTLSYSPTFGYDLCSRRVSEGRLATPDLDLSSWRTAGIGGDMIQPHVLERFAGAFAACRFDPKAFLPSYGMAEAVLAISFSPRNRGMLTDSVDRGRMADEGRAVPADPKSGDSRRFVLCGRPLAGHVAEIRGEDGEILPDRMIGRIFVKGPSLMAGYYGNPEETARVLSPDGWLDTGDLGYSLEGALVITGRAKDLIIIAGRNIWPQDLEWSVEESLDLRRGDTCAFSIEGPEGQEQVVMLAVARQTETAEREAMRQGAQSLLQRAHGIEAKVVLVAPRVIPQTSSGKIARARAKAAYLAGHYQESGADAARPR
ncbi:MAG TPA: fatty acyl-AMP ligase [Hypericibacter adhaerens]|jgi:fatty-acyl-CoA synthase|uniref:fatty acyl-AMP ligase n=1 Tax=Hypericibacter adhaerens TaxID=2602016 RepID=UPI002CF98BDA|nr:fatty acyl-AMP ligase [Hypericibacter adhaerens]HWA45946.1 fatty acyl-AMP ligase [Hypericibacter adhaerens]